MKVEINDVKSRSPVVLDASCGPGPLRYSRDSRIVLVIRRHFAHLCVVRTMALRAQPNQVSIKDGRHSYVSCNSVTLVLRNPDDIMPMLEESHAFLTNTTIPMLGTSPPFIYGFNDRFCGQPPYDEVDKWVMTHQRQHRQQKQ